MIKKIFLSVLLLFLLPLALASPCSEVDIKIKSLNVDYVNANLEGDFAQIKEVKIYADGIENVAEPALANIEGSLKIQSIYEPLLLGKEIRFDLVLNDGSICKGKEIIKWNTYCGNGTLAEHLNIGCDPSLKKEDLEIARPADNVDVDDNQVITPPKNDLKQNKILPSLDSPKENRSEECIGDCNNKSKQSKQQSKTLFNWILSLFDSR